MKKATIATNAPKNHTTLRFLLLVSSSKLISSFSCIFFTVEVFMILTPANFKDIVKCHRPSKSTNYTLSWAADGVIIPLNQANVKVKLGVRKCRFIPSPARELSVVSDRIQPALIDTHKSDANKLLRMYQSAWAFQTKAYDVWLK